MQFMIMRRANQNTEDGQLPPALEPGAFLRPSKGGVRMLRTAGEWRLQEGPFPSRELVAGFTMLDADSMEDALEQVCAWPLADSGAVFEIRVAGYPGGGIGFDERGTAAGTLPRRNLQLKRYAVFLRADAYSEADSAPPPEVIDIMNRYNEAGVRNGVLLAGEGLRGSASGVRLHFALSQCSVVDGPFTDVKELIAGYWMLQAAGLEQAIEWARSYPFPVPLAEDLRLEVREICELPHWQYFTPQLRRAEQLMRAQWLETGLIEAASHIGRR